MQASSSKHPPCSEWRTSPNTCRHIVPGPATRLKTGLFKVSSARAVQQDQPVEVAIPGSREEAVTAAAAALLGQVKSLAGKRGASRKLSNKGFGAAPSSSSSSSSGRQLKRFSVELPLVSSNSADTAAFVSDLLSKLPPAVVTDAVIVCTSDVTAAAAAGLSKVARGVRVMSLPAACRTDSLSGPLVVVEPTTADVALVEQLMSEVWEGPWALVANPTWFTGVPQQYQEMVNSWEAAYSLAITATQGLMRTEGAVLRQLDPGSSSSPWRVLLKDSKSERFVQVGQMNRRPTSSDLELAFLNATASQSPLTSLVKGVRGLFNK